MPHKCYESKNHVDQQEHPGIRVLIDRVVREQNIECRVHRTQIVPPDFVTEYLGARLPGARDKEIHEPDGDCKSSVAQEGQICDADGLRQVDEE